LEGFIIFSQKEKRAHFNAVARKEKAVKTPSKYSEQSQIDYARGQANARNEAAAIYRHRNSTLEQREEYKHQQALKRQATLIGTCTLCGKPCGATYKQCYACNKASKQNIVLVAKLPPVATAVTTTPAPKITRERKCRICKQYLSQCYC